MGFKLKVTLIITAALVCTVLGGCASCDRSMKSFESDVNGGLNRTVTLYSTTGEKIKGWDGRIDLSQSEEEIMFDLDGKRVIIHGGVVVVEEN